MTEKGSIWVSDQDPDLVCKCAWCFPASKQENFPPIPEGMRGYSDGICKTHLAEVKGSLRLKFQ